MIRVGLVGEDPNDTSSIRYLLEKRYKKNVQFFPLAKNVKGYQLDNPKIKRSLPIEFSANKCHFIVYIRDLDALKSERVKVEKRIIWFNELDAFVNGKGLLLLNIWELEALILGDIAAFNSLYKVEHKVKGDPTFQKDPKEILKQVTSNSKRKFKESHCPEIFKLLDIDLVEKNCSCFSEFIENFDKKIAGR